MKPSGLIDNQIAELNDWRGRRLADLRRVINESGADAEEDWKWGNAVWTHSGNVCALGAFKDHVKINFFQGAFLDDPARLFNAGLEAKASRSIDLREGEESDEQALQALIRAAAAYNEKK